MRLPRRELAVSLLATLSLPSMVLAQARTGGEAEGSSAGARVVSAVKAETLETFAALERRRVAGQNAASDTTDQSPGDATASVGAPMAEAERLVNQLLKEASQREPYSVGSDCQQPRD